MDIMRKCFTVGIAGHIIEIETISPRTCIFCMKYLKEGVPDIRIRITEEDVNQEMLENAGNNPNPVDLETMAACRKVTEKLLDYDIILMHGAVIASGESAYMFSAPSGTGKTTHVKLWLRNLRDSYVVNGDKPFIKIEDNRLVVYGSPWSGQEHMNKNTMLPLKSIVFMVRSEKNHIEKLSFAQAYVYLLQQTYIPHNEVMARKVLKLLSSIQEKVSFWMFYSNNFDDDCFETSYNALINQ